MWSLWDMVPSYGHRATQFIDLLGYFTIKTSDPVLTEMVRHFLLLLQSLCLVMFLAFRNFES